MISRYPANKSKKTTIALLCTALNERGGTSRHMLSFYNNINREKFRIIIIYCSRQEGILKKYFLERGVRKEDLFCFPISRKFLFIPLIIRLRRLFTVEGVDILNTFFLHSDIIGFFAAFLGGVRRLVSSVEGNLFWDEMQDVNKIKQIFYKLINRIIRKYFYKTIAISRELKDELVKDCNVGIDKVVVINVGIELSDKDKVQGVERDFLNKEIIIGNMSRFSKEKGLEYLIKAVPIVLADVPQARFIIGGAGLEEKRLKELTIKLGVQSKISFPGWIDDVGDFMNSIDIFAMSSIREGWGVALLEAFNFAKPGVGFRIGGVKEIISNGKNGLLVEPYDSQQLASAIIKLCKDPEYARILGENGRKSVREKFNIDAEINKIESLYLKAMDSR